jgi:hypothetical protein
VPAEFRPRALLSTLVAHGIDFVVIGGIATVLHGSDRNTFDLDICPAPHRQNLETLAKALLDLNVRLRGIEEDVPFVPDGRVLASMQILTLDTSLGPLDVIGHPDGAPAYPTLRKRAVRLDIGTSAVLVASIEDLLTMKRATNRDKDRLDVEALQAIQHLKRRLK